MNRHTNNNRLRGNDPRKDFRSAHNTYNISHEQVHACSSRDSAGTGFSMWVIRKNNPDDLAEHMSEIVAYATSLPQAKMLVAHLTLAHKIIEQEQGDNK